ncbi:hypothetical protein E3C22_02420 [Jiella endophytica]|uniref:Uncharacterized protein n=1 Tax=Jiella endophytica TaxID=2558362 RepID=A0A4Y8RSR4_9HYPH|nr:hypothetical protein [Jiella endophytica]TFF27335.1 hypothetical protein E3C22_02420 [Jiella endophytica]
MADLSGVLRKTIDGLPRATPQLREKVYEKARAAIQRQIGAANPPLAEQVVNARLAALEDAIARTEEHYAGQEEGAAAPAEAPQPAPAERAAATAPAPRPAAPEQPAAAAEQPAAESGQPQRPARPQPPAAQPAQPTAPRPAPPRPPQRPAAPAAENVGSDEPDAAPQPARAAPPQRPRPPQAPAQPPRQMPAMDDQADEHDLEREDEREAEPQRPAASANPAPRTQPPRPTLPAATMPAQRQPGGQPQPTGADRQEPEGRPGQPFFPAESAEPDAGDLPPALGAPFIVPDDRQQGGAAQDYEARQPDHHDDGYDPQPGDDVYEGDERIPHDIRVDDGDIPEADVTAPRYPTRRPKRSGSGGKIAAAAVIVLLLGGAGTVGWLYRDDIEALLVNPADIGTIAEKSDTTPPGTAEAPASDDAKQTEVASAEQQEPESTRRFTQRLLPDGSEVDEGPAKKTPNAFDEGTNVAAATNVDQTQPPAGATPTISSEIGQDPAIVGAENADQAEAGTPPADGEAAQDATPPAETENQPAAENSGQLEVGQKAVFYQEKTEDLPGTQENGTAVWSLVDQPGTDGKAGEPAIQAVVEVPDEKLKLTLTIKRNTDPTLPASHVIELEFDVPQDFTGGSVANVQRLALKETEQARGEPLIGVAGKISDNYFIIALNNLDQAVQNNLSLLENQKWIDIPIAYSSGRRALISLEKGIPGDRVFKDALKAWQAKT